MWHCDLDSYKVCLFELQLSGIDLIAFDFIFIFLISIYECSSHFTVWSRWRRIIYFSHTDFLWWIDVSDFIPISTIRWQYGPADPEWPVPLVAQHSGSAKPYCHLMMDTGIIYETSIHHKNSLCKKNKLFYMYQNIHTSSSSSPSRRSSSSGSCRRGLSLLGNMNSHRVQSPKSYFKLCQIERNNYGLYI